MSGFHIDMMHHHLIRLAAFVFLVSPALAADLMQHWKLDELSLSYTANRAALVNGVSGGALGQVNHDGTPSSAPVTGLPGATVAPGTAIGLETRFQRIELGAVSPGLQPFSFAFWFKRNSAAVSGFDVSTEVAPQEHILSANQGQTGRWNLNALQFNPATETFDLSFFHHNGVGAINVAFGLASDIWHHVVISRSSANVLKFHLNAEEVFSTSDAASFTHGANGVFLGRDPGLFSNGARGTAASFDDVRIYDNAISLDLIEELAEPRPPSPPWELPPPPADVSTAMRDPYGAVPGNPIANSSNHASLYLGTPSVIRLPDGALLASHDHFGPASGGLLCRVLRSEDNGITWNQIATLDAKWSSFFLHQGALYFMGPNIATNRVLIRRSDDGGFTWTVPSNPSNGILLSGSYHSSSMPVLIHNGRVWRTMEDQNGPSPEWGRVYRAFMMSAPVGANLLDATSWTSSNPLASSTDWLGGTMFGWLEGNAVAAPDGSVKNILRVHTAPLSDNNAAVIHISPDGTTATFDPNGRPDLNPSDNSGYITLPGATKKFLIRRDPQDGSYWSLSSHILPQDLGGNPERTRNTLALIRSTNLYQWDVRAILLHHPAADKYGFHYVDWRFDGESDLIVASRSAWNANSQHDSNLILFHHFENFRELDMASSFPSGESRWEYPDFIVEGIGFRPALLANGERSFSNRSFRWQNVPGNLSGRLITRSNGNQFREIQVTARRDTTLTAMTNSSTGPSGWTALGVILGYDAGGNTPMYGFSRSMSAGERIEIPQLGFSGTLPLIDPGARPLAVWRVTPEALPAVPDSENAFHLDTINGVGPMPVQGVNGAGLGFSNALSPLTSTNQLGLVDMDFTLCAWIRMAPGDFRSGQHIIGKGSTIENASWLLSINRNSPGLVTFSAGSPPVAVRSVTPANDGHWHQLAVVFRRGETMTIHVNGGNAEDSAAAPVMSSNTGPLFLGGAGGQLSFGGALDEVRLYPRALETAEIRSLFLDPSLGQPVAGRGLPLEIQSHPTSGLFLTWPAVPGRSYEIRSSETLSAGSWSTAGEIEAVADRIEWPVAIDAPAAFFQVTPTDP